MQWRRGASHQPGRQLRVWVVCQEASPDAQRNATSALAAVARSPLAAPLAEAFLEPGYMGALLDAALQPPASVRVGLHRCACLYASEGFLVFLLFVPIYLGFTK